MSSKKQHTKASASTNAPYKKDEKPYDYTAGMKGEQTPFKPGGTSGTAGPMDTQHRMKTASQKGFRAGFTDLFEFAGLSKQAAAGALIKLAEPGMLDSLMQSGGDAMNTIGEHPYLMGGAGLAGAGLGAAGMYGLNKLTGGGGGQEEDTIQPPDGIEEEDPDMSAYAQMGIDPRMLQQMQMQQMMQQQGDPYAQQGGYGY